MTFFCKVKTLIFAVFWLPHRYIIIFFFFKAISYCHKDEEDQDGCKDKTTTTKKPNKTKQETLLLYEIPGK